MIKKSLYALKYKNFIFYRLVDSNILSILRQRYEDCRIYEAPDGMRKCKPLSEIYQAAEENYSIKCQRRI